MFVWVQLFVILSDAIKVNIYIFFFIHILFKLYGTLNNTCLSSKVCV